MQDNQTGRPRKRTEAQRNAASSFLQRAEGETASLVGDLPNTVGTSEVAAGELINPFVAINSSGTSCGVDVNTGVNPLSFIGSGQISSIINKYASMGKQQAIRQAKAFVEADDLLSDLVDIKLLFTTLGFEMQVAPPKGADQEKVDTVKLRVTDASLAHNLAKVADDLAKDYIIKDTMILYWKIGPQDDAASLRKKHGSISRLLDICALDPADVDYDNSFGQETMKVKIPDKIVKRIQAAIDSGRSAQLRALVEAGIPQKYIDAVIKFNRNPGGQQHPMVALSNEEGDFWAVVTKERKHHGIAMPRMKTIFLPLETRKSICEGEYLAAVILQHLIMLIKQGESIDNGPNAGSRNNWLKPQEAADLVKVFSTVTKAGRIAINHTTDISYVTPPPESFSTEKYESCETKIFNWAGVDRGVTTGEGGTYSGGFIGIKKLIANIKSIRNQLAWIFCEFFTSLEIAAEVGIDPGYRTSCTFNENVLKEPSQLLKEIESLTDRGLIDPVTALSELGRDADTIRAQRLAALEEIKKSGIWLKLPDFAKFFLQASLDQGSGKLGGTENRGRPANDTTTKDPTTEMQRPAPQV